MLRRRQYHAARRRSILTPTVLFPDVGRESGEMRGVCCHYGVLYDVTVDVSDGLGTCRTGFAGGNGRPIALVGTRTRGVLTQQTRSIGQSDLMFAYLNRISHFHA